MVAAKSSLPAAPARVGGPQRLASSLIGWRFTYWLRFKQLAEAQGEHSHVLKNHAPSGLTAEGAEAAAVDVEAAGRGDEGQDDEKDEGEAKGRSTDGYFYSDLPWTY